MGAKITVGSQSSISDEKGYFIIKNIKTGTYTLTAAHPECELFSQQITVNQNLHLDISMEHHVHSIEEVRISGTARHSGTVSVSVLDKNKISRNSSENLGNILTAVSGINAVKTGNNIAKPVIRGLYGSRILIFNNDVRMAEQEWGVEHAPSIDPGAFERIKIIKGAGTLKYGGDASGGVIVMEPANFPAKDSLMGNLSASYISNGKGTRISANLVKTWNEGWYVRSQGSYKKLGDLSIPKTTLQNTGTEENAFSFGGGFRRFEKGFEITYNGLSQHFGIFRGSHLGAAEEFVNAVNNQFVYNTADFHYQISNPKQEVAHHLAKAEAFWRSGSTGKFTLQYAFQLNRRKEYDIRKAEYTELPSMDLRLISHSMKLEHLLERENWQLESGINFLVQDNFPNPATRARRLIPDYYRYDAGIFSHLRYSFSDKLKFEAGLRYDANYWDAYKYYDESEWNERFAALYPQFVIQNSGSRVLTRPQFKFQNISANLGFAYRPNEQVSLQGSYSLASRSPNAAELFADGLHHSASIIERGNLSISKEVMHQFNFSAEFKAELLSGYKLQVNPYYMISDSFINQIPTGALLTVRGVFPVWDFQQVKARMMGVDADSELKFNEVLKWTSALSYVKGDDLTHQEALIVMPPLSINNALELMLPGRNNLYIQLAHHYTAEQKRFPVRNFTVPVIKNGLLIQETVNISSPPAAFSLWNLSAGIDVLQNLYLQFSVRNLFNKEYREYLNRLRYFSPETGRNVVISLKYNF